MFDHSWADAYEHAGGDYYPKLQIAVPFTPVPGRRLLVRPGPDDADYSKALLAPRQPSCASASAPRRCTSRSSAKREWKALGAQGFLQRTDQQFHWRNDGYATFDDFLGSLASRKRKAVRKEREQALSGGLTIEWITRRATSRRAHWDAFFDFYMDTGRRKWGRPYLNRRFFSLLGDGDGGPLPADHGQARRAATIAGALNLIGGDCLYGRYWGAVEHHPCLHFEVCYYQAIDYAIAHGLARVEAGAQGEHKLARGYLPTKTYSAHYIADPGLAPRHRALPVGRARGRRREHRRAGRVRTLSQRRERRPHSA